jgi:hypothetical protein
MLFYDDKVMEDVDDLSDTEKVSLISDIDVNDEPASQDIIGDQSASRLGINIDNLGNSDDLMITNVEKLDLDKEKTLLNQANTKKVNRIANGIQLTKSKQKCGHKAICDSCYCLQQDPYLVNITNQDQLIDYLGMAPEDQEKQRRINIATQTAQGASKVTNLKGGKNGEPVDDTVTEEEYGSSDDEGTKDSAEKEKKKKKDKDSKYTHSRFSSQIPDLDDMNVMMGDMNINDDANIDDTEIKINDKKLNNDKRNMLKKETNKTKVNLPMKFQDDIDSIQNRNDTHEFIENTDGLISSPIQKQKNKVVPLNADTQIKGEVGIGLGLDDELVLMGSKNVKDKKKKSTGKKLGIANLNVHTLKKNKLAIAFNNLEMDKTGDEKESEDD